jgi:hypothetical protein
MWIEKRKCLTKLYWVFARTELQAIDYQSNNFPSSTIHLSEHVGATPQALPARVLWFEAITACAQNLVNGNPGQFCKGI